MGTIGTIGNVDTKFTASTGDFTASLDGMGNSAGQMAAKVKAAGDSASGSIGKMSAAAEKARYAAMMAGDATEAAVGKMTVAHERAARAWQREKVQQDLATDSLQAAARAEELAALKADILARSTEKLGLSSNSVAAKFQLMSREVSASMGVMGEKIAATAEKAELSADGIAAGFGGLGKLLGVGIAGELVTHTLDDIAHLNVEIGDLHEKTGIAVQSLAGLRLAAQSKGLDFTTISTGMIRLGKAMYEAKSGMLEAREAFQNLGISMDEVNNLSVEQMFYRISKAVGENRSLVVSDGTAMQLFSRGGKELVPMLREWGGNLEQVAKQQGALTGVTDQSVAASQKWLQTTSDLSAEFHAGLTPLLVELVKHMGGVEAAMRGLDMVTVGIFGTMAEAITTAVEAAVGLAKVYDDISNMNWKKAAADANGTVSQVGGDWKALIASEKGDYKAMRADWASSGTLPQTVEPAGQNQAGDVDGALVKSAKQQLADMEQKHALSHAQLVAFWKQELTKAKPGSTDYEQVNLMLGNLAQHPGNGQHKADQEQMEGFQQGLADLKNAHEVSVGEEYSYWAQKLSALKAGSHNYIAVSHEMGNLYQSILKEQDAANKQASGGHGLMILPKQFQGFYGQTVADPTQPGPEPQLGGEDASRIKSQTGEQVDYLKNLKEGVAIHQESADQMSELAVKMAVARGEMSKMDAAEAMAALHAQEYSEALERLQEALANTAQISNITDRNKASSGLQNQIDSLNGTRAAQIVEDNASVNEDTLGGSIHRAMNLYVQQATDTAAQISQILTGAFEGVNESLSHSLMAKAYNGREYRRNIENGLSETTRGIGSQLLNSGFKQLEGGVLGHFGVGSNSKPDGSSSNPLWVRMADGSMAHASALGGLFNRSGGGAGGLQTTQAKMLSLIPSVGSPSAPGGQGGWDQFFSNASGSAPDGIDLSGGPDASGSTTTTRPAQSGWGNMTQSVVGSLLHLLPGFASGGAIPSNMPAIVGENGPEVFMPASSGRIIPNDQLGGGGSTTHNISIDARGATDPAQTEAAVHRAMRQYLPQAVAASRAAAKEDRARRPASAH